MTQQQMITSVVAFGVVLLIAGFIYDDQPHAGPTSLAERCSELGGEWIYKSADLLCLLPDGQKLSYSPANDSFLPYLDNGGVVAVAQASSGENEPVGTCLTTPDFEDYKTEVTFDGQPRVDFSTNEDALHYRTAISKDVARGVNFAGRYVVSTWGCGAGCVGSAVVNAESGKILEYGLKSTGYEFEKGSRLLDAEREGYLVIEDDALKDLCK